MSNGYIDDSDSRVAYTGSWTQITRPGPYASSLHQTTQSGASATVHFTGTLGRVYGTVPACDSSIHQESVILAITLDNVSAGQVTQTCGAADRDNVIFYDSGTLSGGNQPHTISFVNQLGNCLPFQFDAFFWQADSATSASTAAVAAPPNSVLPMPSGSTVTVVQGNSGSSRTSVRGSSFTTTTAPVLSGTSLAADSAPSSSVQILTVNGVVTSMIIAPAATSTSGSGGAPPHGSSSASSPSVGLIVGCVMGALLLLLLLLLLFNFCRRRRRAAIQQLSAGEGGVTPFHLAAEGAIHPSMPVPLDPEAAQRRLKFSPFPQDTKIDHSEESSSSSAPQEIVERRPVPGPGQERDFPSSESRPRPSASLDPLPFRPSSGIFPLPSEDRVPAYRPLNRAIDHLEGRVSHLAEAPPSYDNC